jgi:large subunit ribosomal protein L13
MRLQKTYSPKAADVQRAWFVVDAADLPLGRLSSEVARILKGKHKPMQAPHVDTGDYVIVVNADKVRVSGRDKKYYRHSGYPGGLTEEGLESLRVRRPEEIVRRAVRGMLPKNRLGRQMLRKLKVYAAPDHPHEAQKPTPLAFDIRKVES